jgi:hypothetical protein
MDNFRLNDKLYIDCRSEKTLYGFRHVAELRGFGCGIIAKAKCCYYNRTRESYEFQSVIHALLKKSFSPQLAGKYMKKIDTEATGAVSRRFGTIAAVAKLGELLCEKIEDKNRFQKSILGTIPGIDFPEDFDGLSEEEKQKRLSGAITTLKA